ncbi:ATP-binding protein [Streptomyces sp. NBC_01477]|uniref:ATP-binding protein n=1 Tax=Streptomyces sp. NBC_01477 TaxID=2976015 RepID=UPI002E32F6F2|nr:ATP-binding protein [Streptomyces sp. NBC_01477]
MSTPPAAPPPAAAPAPAAPAPAPAAPAAPPPSAGAPPPEGAAGGSGGAEPARDPGAGGGAGAPSDSVGAGESAAEATARTGRGSKRRGLLREARLRVEGDAVAGDKFVVVTGTERQVTLRTLSPASVETVRHAFHEPPRWDEIRLNAARQRSVVLRGPAGSGKTAAAVRLLQAQQVRAWYLLDSVADLARIAGLDELDADAGLLLNSPRDAEDLRGPLLEGLEHQLEQAGVRLVLTVDTDIRLDRGVLEYVQRLARPTDLDAVLRRHLTHRVGAGTATELMAQPQISALADELLGAMAACRDAARLAEALADEHTGGGVDADRVRALLDRGDTEDLETWFENLADPELRTEAIALAVLNGLAQEDIALAAESLLGRFEQPGRLIGTPEQERPPKVRDPFAVSRRSRLDRLRARTVATVTRGDFGRVPCTAMEYRDAADPRRLIRHVWSEYRIQPQLLDWLGELVDSPSEQIRSFAGTALGLIAGEAFDLFGNRVFPGWIHRTDLGWRRREAVAYALRVCVEDPALRPGVRALVDSWYLAASPENKAAAARAYGLCLGGADLPTAVDALTRLGTVDRMGVAIAVGDGFADLVEEDVAGNAPVVLKALAGMVAQHESRPTGHLAFLILADSLVTEEAHPAPGSTPRSRPRLLELAARDPGLREVLAGLWTEVICGELFAEEAATVLAGWAALAESDPKLLDDLIRMLRDLAQRSTRTGELLHRYTVAWDAPDALRPLHRAARLIRMSLKPAGS